MTSILARRLNLRFVLPASIGAATAALFIFAWIRRRQKKLQDDQLLACEQNLASADGRKQRYKAVAMRSADRAPVIASDSELAARWPEFERRARRYGYCGLDCEWRWREENLDGKPGMLALLQVATPDGWVLLVRVQQLESVPRALEEFLADPGVLKFGVGVDGDAKKLSQDLGCLVSGWVDIRYLVDRLPAHLLTRFTHRGLKPLARDILGVDYVSYKWVARTDWELPRLTLPQVRYAALDALVGAMLPGEILILRGADTLSDEVATSAALATLCAPFVNLVYVDSYWQKKASSRAWNTTPNGNALTSSSGLGGGGSGSGKAMKSRDKFARQNPLYHNCQMLAPDGLLMCTLDKRKADWYTERSLATVVATEPVHVIRLNFEPRERPRGDQSYYLTNKENRCVVCASENSLHRKKVIPDEFRQHFPELLKSHKSHDVLLLCSACHTVSERHTLEFKQLLLREFDLDKPIQEAAVAADAEKRAKSLAKALLSQAQGRAKIPPQRLTQLSVELHQLLKHPGAESNPEEFTVEQLEAVMGSTGSEKSSSAVESHGGSLSSRLAGIIVKTCLESGRLLELERRFRDHFLSTMSPRYLPSDWSVGHQHDLLAPKLQSLATNSSLQGPQHPQHPYAENSNAENDSEQS